MEDYIVRADAAKQRIRAFACTSQNMVEKARSIHNTSPVATAALGRLLTAGVMMGSMMKNEEDRLTLKVDGTGPMRGMLVTADCSGHVKGYPYNPLVIIPANSKGKLDVSGALGKGMLSVISDIGLKEPYSGQVGLVSGEIAEDIAYYYASSEQVPSTVGLGVLMNKNNTVRAAGGFIIQLMPDCPEEVISKLENSMKKVTSVTDMLKTGMTPDDILGEILGGLDMQITSKMPCSFYCNCSRDRVERALISTGRKELQDMIDGGKNIEVKCDFCGKAYNFSPDELTKLLIQAKIKP